MADPFSFLKSLRRPRLLVRAANLGLADYDPDIGLKRLFPEGAPETSDEAFDQLLAREAELNAARQAGGATYSVARHIEVLAALIAEARRLTARAA